MLDLLIPTIAQGLLWSLLALGVYITFRVLDIADLSVEGTFPLGAAVAATCITSGHRWCSDRTSHDKAEDSRTPLRYSDDDRSVLDQSPRDGTREPFASRADHDLFMGCVRGSHRSSDDPCCRSDRGASRRRRRLLVLRN